MKFIPQTISDILLIEPDLHGDDRGYFIETFRIDLLEKAIGYKVHFVQDNESKSSNGVLRGLHYQLPPFSQAKLVRVIDGSVLDVVLDIRKSSPTFGQHISIELSAKNKKQLFIPRGFAHGFIVLSESATFAYKVDNFYAPHHDRGVSFDDKKLNIDWQLSAKDFKISNKDKAHPSLENAKDLFD